MVNTIPFFSEGCGFFIFSLLENNWNSTAWHTQRVFILWDLLH